MSTKFKTIITTAGAEKLAAATVPGGKKVSITVMAVGDGGGTLPEPNAGQTKLINEVWRHALNKISQDSRNSNYIVAELVIPPEVGGFWMRELGLYDDEGILIAVANMAESYKPELAEGSGRAQTCRMVIIVSSIALVELSIDSTMVMATQDYVDDKLAEHEKSRNHPDATLKEKGFVQLSSATDSTSEALAATPKAVKAAYDLANGKYTAQDASTAQKGIVQLNSTTDSSDETQAATPKAVKIAMDNANARLAKERNGGDIPNKPLFVQNIGLQDTVNKAAGALQKDQNLNDIPDKAQARNALQLGTAATATLTTSTTDDATGRVLKVGDRGLGKGAIPALRGFDFYQYWFAAGETLFIETNSAINFPPGMPEFSNTYIYVNVVGIRDSNNDCALLLSRYDANISYLVWRKQAGTSRAWQVLKVPATVADIGAMPRDSIGTIGNNSRMASADSPGWWLVSLDKPETVADFPRYPNGNRLYSYGFMFVARSGNIWLQQYFSHTGASASRQTWNGDMSERTPWVIDYSTANPPPATDLSAYATQQWVLQNFVQNIDLTAPAEVGFRDGWGYPRGTDGAAMYNFNMVGGSSNVGNFIVRYTRKLVNNTWYVIN
ncbi:phage tail protein [Citrobacter portucalensis]|uniref:phage tail protein n=1 Tax=Citrobacter portucalensis TaxID=1639133 RepID=UPI0021622AED|nr:phage tail protein [Citrobacter portucalensis]MCS0536848.1 phage tail protein [Citrobacter portucalensis]